MGIVRSLIILPASALMALTPHQLEAVLVHELEHVRRADYFWNLIQTTVETLFFFHPAVWWLGARLRQQRELCCDDAAVQACADPLIYATALLRLEERRNQQLGLAMALDGHRSSSGLRARISRVLGEANGGECPRELTPLPLAPVLCRVPARPPDRAAALCGIAEYHAGSTCAGSVYSPRRPRPSFLSPAASPVPAPAPAPVEPSPVPGATMPLNPATATGQRGTSGPRRRTCYPPTAKCIPA